MLTVIKNGQYTGTQYPDGFNADKQAEIRAFHESQGEQVLDLPLLEREVDNSSVPPTVAITTPPPTQQQIDDDAQDRQETDTAVTGAAQKLINNADLIRQAMNGVADARAALDTAIPIDNTNTQTALDSIAQRQAAVLFLAANSLRAAVHVAKNGTLPDNVVEAFLK